MAEPKNEIIDPIVTGRTIQYRGVVWRASIDRTWQLWVNDLAGWSATRSEDLVPKPVRDLMERQGLLGCLAHALQRLVDSCDEERANRNDKPHPDVEQARAVLLDFNKGNGDV